MAQEDNISTLRELLLEEPSRALFARILELFADWEEEETLEVGIAYASAHLEPLDESLRYAEPAQCWPGCPKTEPGPALQLVRRLYSYANELGNEGVIALADSPYSAELTMLRLYHNAIRNKGATAIAGSPHLAKLKALFIYNGQVGTVGAKALANSPYMAKLELLNLYNNNIGVGGLRAIVDSPHMAKLTTLHIEGNKDQSKLLEFVLESTHLQPAAKRSCLSRLRLDAENVPEALQALWEELMGEE